MKDISHEVEIYKSQMDFDWNKSNKDIDYERRLKVYKIMQQIIYFQGPQEV